MDIKNSNLNNWIIEDGFATVESGEFRISKGTLRFYDEATEEWVVAAVQYDGASDPCKWGRLKNFEDLDIPSGHLWTNRPGEYNNSDWSWKISDGWNENDAMGLPGLYEVEHGLPKGFLLTQMECSNCHIYTNKFEKECEHCQTALLISA